MRKTHFLAMGILGGIWSIILCLTACSQIEANQAPALLIPASQTPSAIIKTAAFTAAKLSILAPTATVIYSAPRDAVLDETCRMTINFFFSYQRGVDPKAFRNLFIPSSQYLADGFTPPTEARILLKLLPASEEWLADFPGTPMPGAIIPEGPREYVYYVEFSGHYGPKETPISYYYPDFWTMHMVADGPNSCKIKSYGKG